MPVLTPRMALGLLVVATTLLRLGWAACLGPGNDEAYYYLFTIHQDWSYFDHPPLVGLVGRAGLGLVGGEFSAFGLRLGFVLLAAGTTLAMARLGSRLGGPWAGVLAAFLLNAAGYFGVAAGTFALPDGPLVFFWVLTLERLVTALAEPGSRRLGPWVGVGLAWGGALLSKYQAACLPLGVVAYLAVEPAARAILRRPGPYLAAGLGLLLFAPVILWNASHGWASFAFQGGRALGGLEGLNLLRPAAALIAQAAYLLPWVGAVLVVGLVRGWRSREPAVRLLVCQAAVPLALFAAVACVRPILPHWPLVGYLAAIPLAGRAWAEAAATEVGRRRLRRRLVAFGAVPVVAATLVAAQARFGPAQAAGLPPQLDPTVDTYGWDQVAAALRARGLVGRPGTFLFTSTWYDSGQLAFALRGAGPVLCYRAGPGGSRGFAQWSRPEDWLGLDGILLVVGPSSTEPQVYDRWFGRIEPLGSIEVKRSGSVVRTVRLYRCAGQRRPFPFDGGDVAAALAERPGGRAVAARVE